MSGGEAIVENAPLGVLFCIEPWNFPYYQLARVAGPNLMIGNTLIAKHAPNVPQCALAFEKLFIGGGAPKGTYTNVFLSNEQAAEVIADPRIRGVALTGSEHAGSAVAAEAGKALKKSTMELGGADAERSCVMPMKMYESPTNANMPIAVFRLMTITGARVSYLYDLMDAAYDAAAIHDHSRALGHAPIIDRNYRAQHEAKAEWAKEVERMKLIHMPDPDDRLFDFRTMAERVNARLKDEFGARVVRVRGAIKVKCHLMFGVVALAVDQILRLTQFRPAPA